MALNDWSLIELTDADELDLTFLVSVVNEDVSVSMIIDNGSDTCKAGLSSDYTPRTIFPTTVGHCQNDIDLSSIGLSDHYVGVDAQTRRDILALTYPVEDGIVTHWDDMEKIWHHAYRELETSPENQPVLLTQTPLNSRCNREKMIKIMFETFNTPSMYIATQGVLTLYSTGRSSGISVESGEGVTHTLPIFDGYALPCTTLRLNVAGRDLTDHLAKTLAERGYTPSREAVRDIKESLCYVALDFEKEMSDAASSTSLERTYDLPDGQTITIGSERFRCPEALFQPPLLGLDSVGIHDVIYSSIMKCESSVQEHLYTNTILSGGSSLFPGLAERMQKELSVFAPTSVQVQITAPPNRKHAVWIGGSILSCLPTYRQLLISKLEYDELGAYLLSRRNF